MLLYVIGQTAERDVSDILFATTPESVERLPESVAILVSIPVIVLESADWALAIVK